MEVRSVLSWPTLTTFGFQPDLNGGGRVTKTAANGGAGQTAAPAQNFQPSDFNTTIQKVNQDLDHVAQRLDELVSSLITFMQRENPQGQQPPTPTTGTQDQGFRAPDPGDDTPPGVMTLGDQTGSQPTTSNEPATPGNQAVGSPDANPSGTGNDSVAKPAAKNRQGASNIQTSEVDGNGDININIEINVEKLNMGAAASGTMAGFTGFFEGMSGTGTMMSNAVQPMA